MNGDGWIEADKRLLIEQLMKATDGQVKKR